MNPLNVVVPFDVFTAYRDRRSRGGLAGDAGHGTPGAGAVLPAQEVIDGADALPASVPASLPASTETAERTPALAAPAIERIPS